MPLEDFRETKGSNIREREKVGASSDPVMEKKPTPEDPTAIDMTPDVDEERAYGSTYRLNLAREEVEQALKVLQYFYDDLNLSARHFKMFQGDQLSEEEKEIIEKANGSKPNIVVNIIRSRVAAISGTQRQARTEIRCLPRGDSDVKDAEIMTKMCRYISNINDLQSRESDCFLNGLISEMGGWLMMGVEQNEKGKWEIKITNQTPETIFVDPNSRESDLSDAEFIFRAKWMRLPQIIAMFPAFEGRLRGRGNPSSSEYREYQQQDRVYDRNPQLFDKSNGRYRVFEKWYIKKVMRYHSIDENGEMVKLFTEADMKDYVKEQIELTSLEPPIFKRPVKEIWIKTFSPSLLENELFQDQRYDFQIYNQFGRPLFPLFPFWAWNVNGLRSGIVSDLVDPQRFLNKYQRWIIEEFQHSISSGKFYEEGSLIDEDYWRDQVNTPNFFGKIRKGAQAPQNLSKGQQFPQAALAGTNNMLNLFNEISIASPAFVGKGEGSGQSGVRYDKQVQQSSIQLEPILDNFKRFKNNLGYYMVKLSKQVYNYEKWISATNEDEGFFVNKEEVNIDPAGEVISRILNNITEIDVDVVVVQGPLSPTERRARAFEMFELSGKIPPEYMRWGSLIRNLDMPDSEEWAKEIERFIALQTQGAMGDPSPQATPQGMPSPNEGPGGFPLPPGAQGGPTNAPGTQGTKLGQHPGNGVQK